MKIVLVAMPWHALESAALPLGLLKACAKRCRADHDVQEHYANLDWADTLLTRSQGAITPEDYDYVANVGVWHSLGEWVFAGALHGDPMWRQEAYLAYLQERKVDPGKTIQMREHADDFVDETVADLLRRQPDLVGFSTTFSQNTASLAVATRLKRERPDLPVVFGGGNCDGPMGRALASHFPFVDFVVSGEGERAFVALVDALDGDGDVTQVPGLVWRDGTGCLHSNVAAQPVPMHSVPRPDYDGWHDHFRHSQVGALVRPQLILEAARGCWWGEKHHCKFCGLNATSMTFRAKPASMLLSELKEMVCRHRVLDVVMVDNIMSNDYFTELLPQLRELDWDLKIRYEVKANLRSEQLKLLAAAGVRHIQPGIESLSSRVLTLMDKGVHATQNVQVLRDAEEHGLTVDWNILYGFPGETSADYDAVLRQMEALVHLQPPAGTTRILLERFSPYFERPELGFRSRQPAEQYQHVYDRSSDELRDLAYQFEGETQGLHGEQEERLAGAVSTWQAGYAASTLVQSSVDGGVLIQDARQGRPATEYVIGDPAAVAALDALRAPRSLKGVSDILAALPPSKGRPQAAVVGMDLLREHALLFEEGGRVVALPTQSRPLRPGNAEG